MRITMIGSGYVGLVSGACFSEFGHDVICFDTDAEKIAGLQAGKLPIFEPGLDALVASNVATGRLRFDTDLRRSVMARDAVFIAVGTPSRRGDGGADLRFVFDAVRAFAPYIDKDTLVITKSTVPVGTGRRIQTLLKELRPEDAIEVAANPEFLREGAAIQDFMRPDRIIAGTESERAQTIIKTIYRPLFLNETPLLFFSLESAELTKYAGNAFLAAKVTFINEIADLCEKVGADVQDVARGIGLDGRIGRKFLHAGPGFGGSCFPKDVRALEALGAAEGVPTRIVSAVNTANEQRKRQMADKIVAAAEGTVEKKVIAVLGLTYKPNTDDMRESPSLVILPALAALGARLRAYDPEGMKEARKLLKDIDWCADPYETATGADVLVFLTEWNEFRALDLSQLKARMQGDSVVDLRNIYRADEMRAAGFRYYSVGR